MELRILDKYFVAQAVYENFESLIWTERFNKCGDFELHTIASDYAFSVLRIGYYVEFSLSKYAMIIEKIELNTSEDEASTITVSGRSLESILDRRVLFPLVTINTTFQLAVKKLLDITMINPTSDIRRLVPYFTMKMSTDPKLTTYDIVKTQFTGDVLLEAINSLCVAHNVGYSITFDANYHMVFELCTYKYRTYDQTENSWVIFSPAYDNIINSNYVINTASAKNFGFVAGEGEGVDRKSAIIMTESLSGLDRKELFIDARDLQQTTEDSTLTDAEYADIMRSRGYEKLSENLTTTTFDGSIDISQMFKYHEDFELGDVVEIVNEYGISTSVQITEMIISVGKDGVTYVPTLATLKQ